MDAVSTSAPQTYAGIDRRCDGTPLSKQAQTSMVGNSVSPKPMEALVRANYTERCALRRAA